MGLEGGGVVHKPRVVLSGDPGDEDGSVSRPRAVAVRVGVVLQYRSRFVPASPEAADEYAARQRVERLRDTLALMLEAGLIEGFRLEDVRFDVLPAGA